MVFKVLHFLALFGYLNVLCYEVKFCNLWDPFPVAASDTLLEVVLEDIFDVSQTSDEQLPEMVYDEYRILLLTFGLAPVVLFVAWLLRRFFVYLKQLKHPFYRAKTRCRPGYYLFLYRFRPF